MHKHMAGLSGLCRATNYLSMLATLVEWVTVLLPQQSAAGHQAQNLGDTLKKLGADVALLTQERQSTGNIIIDLFLLNNASQLVQQDMLKNLNALRESLEQLKKISEQMQLVQTVNEWLAQLMTVTSLINIRCQVVKAYETNANLATLLKELYPTGEYDHLASQLQKGKERTNLIGMVSLVIGIKLITELLRRQLNIEGEINQTIVQASEQTFTAILAPQVVFIMEALSIGAVKQLSGWYNDPAKRAIFDSLKGSPNASREDIRQVLIGPKSTWFPWSNLCSVRSNDYELLSPLGEADGLPSHTGGVRVEKLRQAQRLEVAAQFTRSLAQVLHLSAYTIGITNTMIWLTRMVGKFGALSAVVRLGVLTTQDDLDIVGNWMSEGHFNMTDLQTTPGLAGGLSRMMGTVVNAEPTLELLKQRSGITDIRDTMGANGVAIGVLFGLSIVGEDAGQLLEIFSADEALESQGESSRFSWLASTMVLCRVVLFIATVGACIEGLKSTLSGSEEENQTVVQLALPDIILGIAYVLLALSRRLGFLDPLRVFRHHRQERMIRAEENLEEDTPQQRQLHELQQRLVLPPTLRQNASRAITYIRSSNQGTGDDTSTFELETVRNKKEEELEAKQGDKDKDEQGVVRSPSSTGGTGLRSRRTSSSDISGANSGKKKTRKS